MLLTKDLAFIARSSSADKVFVSSKRDALSPS